MTKFPTDSGLYVIRNKVNDRLYIGSAKNLRSRKSEHISALRKNNHHSTRLQRSWNKHGPEVFVFEVLALVPTASLREEEQRLLDALTPCYNMTTSAFRPTPTAEAVAELRKLTIQRWTDPEYRVIFRAKSSRTQRAKFAHIEHLGRKWSVAELAEHYNINRHTLHQRLKCGWDLIRAISHQTPEGPKCITFEGQRKTVAQWAAETGIPVSTLYYRLGSDLTPEETLNPKQIKRHRGRHTQ